MSNERASGVALIGGFAIMIVVMAFHPTGKISPAELESIMRKAVTVHAVALACLPVLFFGAVGLSRRLEFSNPAVLALIVFGFGLVAVMSSAVASGLIIPAVFRQTVNAAGSPQTVDTWHIISYFTFYLNQGFAQVYVAASSLAIALWSAAGWSKRQLDRRLAIYGFILALATLGLQISGHLPLDAHPFGMVVLGEAIWFIGAGIRLCGADKNTAMRDA